ncbi:MAG: coproporphyrinogen III oxidase, partial [Planctomycetota bacterium]
VNYAFDRFLEAGYTISSGYTVFKNPDKVNFSYRDNLFQGSDLIATGIASFGHLSGVHYQNKPEMQQYLGDLLERGELPVGRALRPTAEQLLIRETILLLKRGYLEVDYFRRKFGVDIIEHWRSVWEADRTAGMLQFDSQRVELTRKGLLQVDGLLPDFFEPAIRGVRYT